VRGLDGSSLTVGPAVHLSFCAILYSAA